MNNKRKIIYIMTLLILIVSVIFLPCFAFANTLGDFTNSDAYAVTTDNLGQFVFSIYDLNEFDFPIIDITTQIPYSDNETAFSLVTMVVTFQSFEDGISLYQSVSNNAPNITLDLFADEEEEDLLWSINVYLSDSDGVYNVNIDLLDIAGYGVFGTLIVDIYNIDYADPNQPEDPDDFEAGYDKGFQDGQDSTIVDESPLGFGFDLLGGIFLKVGNMLNIELFPNFTLGFIISIPILFCLLKWFLDIVRG